MNDTTDTPTGEDEDEDLATEDTTTDTTDATDATGALEHADDPATEDPGDPTSTEVR